MTKDKFNWRFCLCCGHFFWFIVNLLQGIFTEIQEDEAYYALYGEHLAWGYFDHPPMVGLMTFLSSILFSGTLGVRFFTILASCLSLFVIWRIATFNDRSFDRLKDLEPTTQNKVVEPVETPTHQNIFLFFIIAFSVVMFNIYGFVTTPDVGLILFSALFLLVYQRYLTENTWPRVLLMGVLMACMIYSKYHAFLILGLIVLSNLKLLKNSKFWIACLVALALLTPHILWQVNTGFPSFKYHLSQRSEPFRWSYFLEYLPNQLLIFNPFTLGAVVYVLIKSRAADVFERGLKFILIGFFFFFWLMAFRGHVEPHWTIVCVIPVIVLVYRKSLIDIKLERFTKHFILPSLLLVLAFRVVLLTPLASRFGFGGKDVYYKAIETAAGEHPVVFQGSFQQPSLYHYFTGKESSTLRAYYDRKTQFDLWQFDTAWIGQTVFICGPVIDLSKEYRQNDVCFEGYLMQRFQTPNRLVSDFSIVGFDDEEPFVIHHGDTLQIQFSIYNPMNESIDFQKDDDGINISLRYIFTNQFCYCYYDDAIQIAPHSTYSGQLYTIVGESVLEGRNRLAIGLGDRVATFVTEEKHVDVIVRGKGQ